MRDKQWIVYFVYEVKILFTKKRTSEKVLPKKATKRKTNSRESYFFFSILTMVASPQSLYIF